MRLSAISIASLIIGLGACGSDPGAEGGAEDSSESSASSDAEGESTPTATDSESASATATAETTDASGTGDGDGEEDTGDGDTTSSTGDGDTASTKGDGDATTEGDGDGDGDGEPVDCDNLPDPVVTELDGPLGSAGLAFDGEGRVYGSDTMALFRAPHSGSPMLFVPGMGGRGGMVFLDNGDLAMVTGSEDEVRIVHPDGSSEPPWSFFSQPYGLAVHPDGSLFVADRQYLYRIDPGTGDYELMLSTNDIPQLRTITFDADYGSMFIASGYAPDMIYRAYFDDQGDFETPIEWATIGGNFDEPYIDGLKLDACGNLYAAEYWDSALFKIGPEGGQAELFVDWTEDEYGHAIEWGSGLGGFSSTAIYLPQPYDDNSVVEVELGVGSAN